MLQIPSFPQPSIEADWAEASCMYSDRDSMSRSEIMEGLLGAEVEDPESVISNIWQEMEWRQSILSNLYPFKIEDSRILRSKSREEIIPYYFLLLISCNSFYRESIIKKWNPVSYLFENLVTLSMKNYIGNAIRIGAPRKDGVPNKFFECINYVCKFINEMKGPDPKIHWKQDAGVDVISWNPIDNRAGQVIVLTQCASGKNWNKKVCDISLKRWNRIIYFAADPVVALAFPFVFNTSRKFGADLWLDFSCDGGILLDRLRISKFIEEIPDSLEEKIFNWSDEHLDKLQWM